MTYHDADSHLQGRCRERRRLQNNTYLERRPGDDIAVRLHSTDVLTFSPDGTITLDTGGWNTVTTKDRMNTYLPSRWRVGSDCGGRLFLWRDWKKVAHFEDNTVTILPTGEVIGGDPEKAEAEWRAAVREVNRERSRIRYWIRKTREHEPAKGLTVQSILEEENVSVRLAKMHVFGIERFLLESGAETLDRQAGYELLRLKLSDWRDVRALKMTCPSTGAVYVATVAPHVSSVPEALDWYFNVGNYLEQVVQQT